METTRSSKSSSELRLENPFSLKVAQVFTGFGIGCGVGIGVGRPIYLGNAMLPYAIPPFLLMDPRRFLEAKFGLSSATCDGSGAIPAIQHVLTAARGATDAFSGVGRHINSSLRKLGLKNIEVGVGCGVGVGHGFGVGLALKPGMVNRIQNSFGEVLEKVMINVGSMPVLASIQGAISGPGKSKVNTLSGTPAGNAEVSSDKVSELKFGNTYTGPTEEVMHNSYASKEQVPERAITSHTERVINNFLQDPLFKDSEMKVNEMVGNLHLENNVLEVLLTHQRVIEELIEENQRLQQILEEDLKIPPSKLQIKRGNKANDHYPCADCFECRRRRQKTRS
ncbi:uncharacterized protein LOC122017435 isoform X2 [Zingiber officinale]|uniref:uncharacterized protein LOC122017435 isoform X2 n=1 Tax=Zingiber officinale TaxID=94328 RepID=UPI001C4BD431|nr:uncharacterized protein LOC122017435 isoform X2 [Zingiber officinale]